ncbi:glycosyltransferase [Chromobacterium alkanivorans]|uniref:glycosyltransferase n=1 Tax=Chromobacterium alkanivorans TaxID=1071719 RepID=UPI001967711C|nr:nucleotide disphospho-sugar-binding domain-containing protein [Chromobacterium alkanivorans]MBN3002859.1 glycosyltransferase [Chromobacterium alkanivorans]
MSQELPPQAGADQPREALIIVASSGTGGDMQPFIALARGLAARGRRVLLLAPELQEEMARAAGLPYRLFGEREQEQAVLDNPDLWHERKGWGVLWDGLIPQLDAIRQAVQALPEDEDCMVLCHPILVPMAALARAARPDLRIVTAYLAPSNLCSRYDLLTMGSLRIPGWLPPAGAGLLWRLLHRWFNGLTLPGLNAARAQCGLPPAPHFFEHMLKTPNASVSLFPRWFAAMQPDWPRPFFEGGFLPPAAPAGPGLCAELETFLAVGDAPIVFTPGTGHRHAAAFFDAALRALRRLGRRGVFVTPHAAQLPPALPDSVLWQAHAPFTALLPRAAALVHHGGVSTMADAMRAGIPQLIVPYGYDQFDNGQRAKRLGVAEVLPAERVSARRMERVLARLLSGPGAGRACRELAARMAAEAEPTRALDCVEEALLGKPGRAAEKSGARPALAEG